MLVADLDVALTATTAGEAINTLQLWPHKAVQVDGLSTGTFSSGELQIQVSADNVAWHDLGSAITLDGYYTIETPVNWLRIYTVSLDAGTPTAKLTGMRYP